MATGKHAIYSYRWCPHTRGIDLQIKDTCTCMHVAPLCMHSGL